MVEQNLTSALILEDDADWDIRLKEQMRDFARASRLLVQPLREDSQQFLDPTFPKPNDTAQPSSFEVGSYSVRTPTTSPYGDIDRWDLLWLGHCGMRFPRASDIDIPLGRAVILNDTTVPEPQHVHMQFGNDELIQEYPEHTRVISRARANTCTLGYALSRPGARKLLWEGGLHKMTGTTDMMLRSICDGEWGRKSRTCLSVQPQIFQHHRPKGSTLGFSDINPSEGKNDRAFTRNIRWSTRMNLAKLVDGSTDYEDQFKDGANSELGDHW